MLDMRGYKRPPSTADGRFDLLDSEQEEQWRGHLFISPRSSKRAMWTIQAIAIIGTLTIPCSTPLRTGALDPCLWYYAGQSHR